MTLPPGPRGALRTTVAYGRKPLEFFREMVAKHGDPFVMPTLFGTMFVTGDPKSIKTIFSADPSTYTSFMGDALEEIAGANSVVVIAGDRHKAERKLMMPHFHGDRMRAHGERIREITVRHASAWKPGKAFALHDTTLKISLDVIVEQIFGVHEPERIEAFRNAVLARDNATSPSIVFFKGLRKRFGGIGPWAKFRRAAKRLDDLFVEEITARRAGGGGDDRADILQQLLAARYEDGTGMSDRAICDELVTLAVAGHETTSISLAWAVYWLLRHPEIQARLLEEIRALGEDPAPEAIAKLPYLDAVCQETLRITHPGTDVTRQLQKPLEVAGFTLPAGMGINVCIPLLHHREDLYPEPEKFRPERFLERNFAPHEFVGFGGGHRRCIGAAFAMYEMKIVLATLVTRFPVKLVDDKPIVPVRWNIFVGPKGGVRVLPVP